MIAFTSSVRAFCFLELMTRETGQKSVRSTTVSLSFITKSRLKSIANFLLGRLAVGTSADATVIVLFCALSITRTALADTPIRFVDVGNDVYAEEIQEAVNAGLIAGFASDKTFRPQLEVTREQMVSMVIDALSKLPVSPLTVPFDPPSATPPLEVSTRPYRDVEVTRWSAAKIKWAKDNAIVLGYSDGTFRPSQKVTRAELMAVLRNAAEFGQATQGSGWGSKPPTRAFSDLDNHWASKPIREMSAYCGVASPLNETGNAFNPNLAARRNYATAATLRMLNCIRN
ncbi:MAG: S-layer homology domain-containing protein [Symplocastrum torsivum CPER-KK1]|jgi:hypothetical protein|uniref:S-layer homology domain-containing protein n=1 Tax=Symplocastrum torsivum CPER-KK1 TaxID=450513 RepID=A0A951PSC7_9CYAN|nr:S-layer homology domain-containing protein [Symplocastrum torsivum CPER-KK1]